MSLHSNIIRIKAAYEPPPHKRRKLDPTSKSINIMDNTAESVDYINNNNNHNQKMAAVERELSPAVVLELREILEHIHSFLELEDILSSRQICKRWNEYFKMKIFPSQLSPKGECNLFPLYMRTMFEKEVGSFEQWFLFFICEYQNTEFKLKQNIRSSDIYPHCWHSNYPKKTRFNFISCDEYEHYERLLTMFMFERHKAMNASLHNILFCWLRGLKALCFYWLQIYDLDCIQSDLVSFHKQLSANYIEPEYGSIPFLQSMTLQKFDYLSSYLGLITMNGDFSLFYKFKQKIAANEKFSVLTDVFSKQHFPNHVYQHLHTFGFGYNVYGQCCHDLIDTVLKICDIPRSVCSLKVIRFVLQPHILVNIQSDLVLNKYPSGNILNVSLNKRIVLLKKLCFYFDLCATIHSSNLNRSHSSDYLVHSQLKKPFNSTNLEFREDFDCSNAQILHNFAYWKRYIVLCHLVYFVKKYENELNVNEYFFILFRAKPDEMSVDLWNNIRTLIEKVKIIYPEFNEIINDRGRRFDAAEDETYYHQMESYLKKLYLQYISAVIFLDCIGSLYTNEESRSRLRVMDRCGPFTDDQFETLKECILASQHIRNHFDRNENAHITLRDAIKNISFHDDDINVNDDGDRDIGLMLKHGYED